MKLHQGNKLPIRLLMRLISLFAVLLLGLMSSQVAIAANSEHLTQLISTKSCENCDLTNLELTYIDLEAADLANSDLTNSRLPGQSLKSATLTSANLQNANLNSADLSYANLANANLVQANLSGAILSSADLTGADLTGANLENARLLGFAGRANLTAANLSEANLKGTRLNDLSFAGANLSHADLSGGVYLAGADFSDAILDGANFSGANFSGANLQNTSWQNADLTGTNLRRADLTGANLTGANLAAINLDDAILYETVGLDPYAEELIQTADFIAKSEDYPGAISYLEKVPSQTKSYVNARNLIAEYTKKQKIKDQEILDSDALSKLQKGIADGDSGNFNKAIWTLSRIPENSSSYADAQKKLDFYQRRQRSEEQARAEKRAEQKRAQSSSQTVAESLRDTDSYIVTNLSSIQSYTAKIDQLSSRCDVSPQQIGRMTTSSVNQLLRKDIKFDNIDFLNQALDATQGGDFKKFGSSCQEVFKLLGTMIEGGA